MTTTASDPHIAPYQPAAAPALRAADQGVASALESVLSDNTRRVYWRIPAEVEYQHRIDPVRDTLGLRAFIERTFNSAPFALLITQADTPPVEDPRIVAMPLSTFMLIA